MMFTSHTQVVGEEGSYVGKWVKGLFSIAPRSFARGFLFGEYVIFGGSHKV